MGFAWYKADQWERLLEISEDGDALEATLMDWLMTASKCFSEIERFGAPVRKVMVGVGEFLSWCCERVQPVNNSSRAEFV